MKEQDVPIRVASRFVPPACFLKQLSDFLVKPFVGRIHLGAGTALSRI